MASPFLSSVFLIVWSNTDGKQSGPYESSRLEKKKMAVSSNDLRFSHGKLWTYQVAGFKPISTGAILVLNIGQAVSAEIRLNQRFSTHIGAIGTPYIDWDRSGSRAISDRNPPQFVL